MKDQRVALPPNFRSSSDPVPLPAQEPEVLTIPRAAKRVGIGVRQLRQAVRRGELPVFRIGAWPRVRWVDVIRWICAQRVPVTSHANRRLAEVLAREARRSHE